MTRVGNFRTPVTNFFLMLYLSSLIPDLDHEYLLFCDDFFLLRPYGVDEARKVRYLQDLAQVKNRGSGLWRESLWRTYDLLTRLKYPRFNFETHTPAYFRRRWVFEAYCEFQDFVTQDRWYGMLGITAILNHVHRHEPLTNPLPRLPQRFRRWFRSAAEPLRPSVHWMRCPPDSFHRALGENQVKGR